MRSRLLGLIFGLAIAATPFLSVGCGGGSTSSGSGSNTQAPAVQTGNVNMMVSDASTEDWATIGVKILAISLVPQGGGTPVSVYTAPTPPPVINLVELDQLSEILGNLTVADGTYTSANLTISGNPGDVLLTVSADPEAGFAGTAGATIPSNQIDIQGTTGSAGSLTIPVSVNFVSPLTVTAGSSNALDLEFDLAHPAFIVSHVPVATGTTMWAVNFNGPVRHHPIGDITRLVLRHTYGSVTAVSTDDTSITITKEFPTEPPVNPETAVAGAQSLQILADATNGTIFYDLDAKTTTTIKSFSAEASTIVGKNVRIAARYQSNGTLVAVRIWSSSTFNNVWISPEGHVLHVNTSTDVITVQNELGVGVPVTVNASTQFFFRTPWNATADATPIATGPGFLTSHNFVRGFKIHASVVDPLATPLVAQTIDIEIARFDGYISGTTTTGFTYTRNFHTASDDYVVPLDYISSSTPNGTDSSGTAISGFKYWNFTFPTILTDGTGVTTSFTNATNGAVNFGGTVGILGAWGETYAIWNDPADPNTWAAPSVVLMPVSAPLGTVVAGYTVGSGGFTMTVLGGTSAVTSSLSTTAGSATLVYQVDRTNNIVTISSVDITTTAGQNTVTSNLVPAVPVRVFGVPQASGVIEAYAVFYYTGTKPND
ncbi:MAG: DUF4382 domain-containing protein [Candidatus Acidiferrales bacterium]|jgi:hypothetical protein